MLGTIAPVSPRVVLPAPGDLALVHAGPTTTAPSAPTHASESTELAFSILPDDGPRLEGQSQGTDALALQEGMNAYGKGEWAQTRRRWSKVRLGPSSSGESGAWTIDS